MKSKYLSAAAALLCAAGLAACGGSGNGSLSLGVQVFGLDRTGLVLSNGGEDLTVTGVGNFFFTKLLPPDAEFNVSIKTTPSGVTCALANNSGKINYYTYLQTTVSCAAVPYELGGTVSGLTADGLVLNNGNMTVAVGANATTWKFGTKIGNQSKYGVTVLSNPVGLTCSVDPATATGTMPQANVTNVAVSCQPK